MLEQKIKDKVQRRLDHLTEMLVFQREAKKAEVPYNTKKLSSCNSKERDIRFNRNKRISKLEQRIKNCKKVLSE